MIEPLRMAGHLLLLPSSQSSLKSASYSTNHQKAPAWRRETLSLTQRVKRSAHPEWPCLGSCPCTCQRPAQPKEGERIKQRISFLFSCKKHLPSGYKCYCICVALYCCPQLASITGSQWQYFYNP